MVSDEKSTLIQIVIALWVMCHFFLAAFKIFSFFLVFRNLTVSFGINFLFVCLSCFGFVWLLESLGLYLLPHLESLLLSFWNSSDTNIRSLGIVQQVPEPLLIFTLCFHSFAQIGYIIAIVLSSSSLTLCLPVVELIYCFSFQWLHF